MVYVFGVFGEWAAAGVYLLPTEQREQSLFSWSFAPHIDKAVLSLQFM